MVANSNKTTKWEIIKDVPTPIYWAYNYALERSSKMPDHFWAPRVEVLP